MKMDKKKSKEKSNTKLRGVFKDLYIYTDTHTDTQRGMCYTLLRANSTVILNGANCHMYACARAYNSNG